LRVQVCNTNNIEKRINTIATAAAYNAFIVPELLTRLKSFRLARKFLKKCSDFCLLWWYAVCNLRAKHYDNPHEI